MRNADALAQRDDGIGALELAFPLAMQRHTGVVLPALALTMPRATRASSGWLRCAGRIAIEIGTAHNRLHALETAWQGWQTRLPGHRADSRLADVVKMMARSPLLTAPGVATTLGITRKAAAHHLDTLQAAAVLREVTGRARWRLFCASDLPLRTWTRTGASRAIGTRPGEHRADQATLITGEPARRAAPPAVEFARIDRMLADAYREIDRATAQVDARVGRPGSVCNRAA